MTCLVKCKIPPSSHGSNQKSLKIKFLSCKKDDNSYYLTFEIDARNLKSSKAKIHVEESELISNEIAVPIKIVTIKPNGIQKVTVSFSKNKLFSQSLSIITVKLSFLRRYCYFAVTVPLP